MQGFRCFENTRVDLAAGPTWIVGPNAQGKTSLLEAACVLLRLQSPRTHSLAQTVRFGEEGFSLRGNWNGTFCEYHYSARRRKLSLDDVEQRRANEYLTLARVVWFGNDDLDLIRGSAEGRRRFLDFAIIQLQPSHRKSLRDYEKALRSRNALLKRGGDRREIESFNEPLLRAGTAIRNARLDFVTASAQLITEMNQRIGGDGPELKASYRDGSGPDFAKALSDSKSEESRLRQTVVGPHRDDLELTLMGKSTAQFASEGQQRTAALALRLAQAQILGENQSQPPLFLIDDIFGELDVARRNRLLNLLPKNGQQLITTTHLDWTTIQPTRIIKIESLRST